MNNIDKYFVEVEKAPPHEKAAVVDMFRSFMGETDFCKLHKDAKSAYTFWLRKVGKCTYGDAIDIVKSLESLPLQYNKAGSIINKLKKLHGSK